MDHLSRREFVKVGGAAASAIGTLSAAGDRVVYGVIGAGAQGRLLLRHMAGLAGCRCAAVCDVDETNLKAGVIAAGSNPRAHQDYRELLERKDIDAVVIATPLSTHFPIARDALTAGKHVFCEPPLVFKPEEVHALRALAAVPETGNSDRIPAALQQVLPDRQSDGRQGPASATSPTSPRNGIGTPAGASRRTPPANGTVTG